MRLNRFIKQSVLLSGILVILSNTTQAQMTLAIADFTNRTQRIYLDSWEQKIPEFLHSELSQSNHIVLVERQSLKALIDEQALSMTGLIDSAAQEVGRLLSARYIITGSINEAGKWLRIDARIINVKTGKVVSEKVQCQDQNQVDKMVQLLANNLRYQLIGEGAYQPKISLRTYPTFYFLVGTLGSGLAAFIVHDQYIQKRHDYQNTTDLYSFGPAYDSANRLYRTRNILLSVTGIGIAGTLYCWIQNLSSDEILAVQPSVLPYMMSLREGEFSLGICVAF